MGIGRGLADIAGMAGRAAARGVEKALVGGNAKTCGVYRTDGKGVCKKVIKPGHNTCGDPLCEALRNMKGQ